MKDGIWLESNGRWHFVDEHASWIRRQPCARAAGLREEIVLKLSSMPRTRLSGADRNAVLFLAMAQGLIRVRGHGAWVTFEATLDIESIVLAASTFMSQYFGPLTLIKINKLPDGPFVSILYQDLLRAMNAGDISSVLHADVEGVPQSQEARIQHQRWRNTP